MGPKIKFSKEQIIDIAFEIAKKEGIDNITIRKVAKKMGSSIAPIYVNFKGVHELIEAVINKIFDLSQQMLLEQSTSNPFHDMGVASLRFAKKYPVLFRDLIMKNNHYMKDYNEVMGTILLEKMKKDPELDVFTDDELMSFLVKMRFFQLGLSVAIANGLLPDSFSENDAISLLESTANDILTSAKEEKNKL